MIRWMAVLGLTLCTALCGTALADGLGAVRWEQRPLLVFAPAADDPRVKRQTALLDDRGDGLIDRRLAVYLVEPARVSGLLGTPAAAADAGALRRRFNVGDDGFQVVLVGLDGGAKMIQGEPIDAASLFATIDAMPMRRRELRQREGNN